MFHIIIATTVTRCNYSDFTQLIHLQFVSPSLHWIVLFFLFFGSLAKLKGNVIGQEGKQQSLSTGTIMSNHFKKKRNFLYMQIPSLSCAKASNGPTQTFITQTANTDKI